MAKTNKAEASVADKVTGSVTGFYNLHKKVLFIACAAVVVVLLAIVIISSVITSNNEKAMVRIVDLGDRCSAYLTAEESNQETFDALVADLNAEIKDSSYVSVKAAYLLGNLYYETEDYQNAYDAYMKCYDLNKDSYFAPLALVNAAAAVEENGDADTALDLYSKVSDYEISGVNAKALFNSARINLSKGNNDLAKAQLESLVQSYSYSEYAALAKNILNVM
ncbi:MAG: tetratricopeptide repeat protein [Sphaerochaetaceae bacterium]|nr:tetratricopeptide repeat protein [Sphaerochaetaceae bacterium]